MLSTLARTRPAAILALDDGHLFAGESIGASGQAAGRLVFNTAMAGYQEILTSPSACGQISVLTYPHAGNYGVNEDDAESSRVQAAGLVVRDLSRVASNFRSQASLDGYLKAEKTVAIADVDTRYITRILREGGPRRAAILALPQGVTLTEVHKAQALQAARVQPADVDWVQRVSTAASHLWSQTDWEPGLGFGQQRMPAFKVSVCDFGVRRSLLRLLAGLGCAVQVRPSSWTAEQLLAEAPDGVVLAGGPGDPANCTDGLSLARALLAVDKLPLLGVGLGHQLMALAAGATVAAMPRSAHGANHPVQNVLTGRVSITQQDHDYAVDAGQLPASVKLTHRSLFDGSAQVLRYRDKAFSFQGEFLAANDPQSISRLVDDFISSLEALS